MAVNCNPVISNSPVSVTACECSLVSFTVNLLNVCNHSTFGIVANVIRTNAAGARTIIATVCRIVNTDEEDVEPCQCIRIFPVNFTDIVIGECCEENITLTVEAHGNYIERCTAQPPTV